MIERGPDERRMELLATLTATLLTNPHEHLSTGQAFEWAQEIVQMAHDEAHKALRYTPTGAR